MTTKSTTTTGQQTPPADTAWPVATINCSLTDPMPEAIALSLMMLGLSRAPEQRRDMLDLYAECLRTAKGERTEPGVRH